MNLQEIKEIAKTRGVKTTGLNKVNLVQQIQLNEGNTACFATDINGVCDQYGCLWRKDCATLSKKQLKS
ncbi:MAG: SAP domain-containing protein [Gammaproteobacteria bacterium]|nr:MAG: SAP domain-containing protein [Gammaproteobacteria bacterium]